MDARDLISQVKQAVPGAVIDQTPFGRSRQPSLWIDLKHLSAVAAIVARQFDQLENLAVMEVEEALLFSYFLRNSESGATFILRGSIVPESAEALVEVDPVSALWPMAEWHEREVAALYGVRFGYAYDGKPSLLPEGWSGFPLRKSYLFPTEWDHVAHARPAGRSLPSEEGVIES